MAPKFYGMTAWQSWAI